MILLLKFPGKNLLTNSKQFYYFLPLRKEIKNLNVKGMDDNNLITLLQQGDRNAYKQLFIKYYSPLCEYASQYISDDDSEELVQELMLFLWETRENLVIETSLKSYLFISTKHRCLNAIRKNQYHERIHNQIYEKIKGLCQSVFEKSCE